MNWAGIWKAVRRVPWATVATELYDAYAERRARKRREREERERQDRERAAARTAAEVLRHPPTAPTLDEDDGA